MTTPTTAEQIDAVLAEFSYPIPMSKRVGSMPTHYVDQQEMAAALFSARATIARLEDEHANAREALRSIAAGVNRAFHECAVLVVEEDIVDGIPPQVVREVNTLVEMLLAERTSADAAERRVEALAAGLRAVEALIHESHGVVGLHLNGDIALWEDLRTGGSFEEWLLDFDTALAAASGAADGAATTED